MFPTLKVRLRGLDPVSQYIVYMDLIPYDDKRYRYVYHSSQWMVAGAGDPPPSIGQVGLTGRTLRNGLKLSRLEGRKLSYARQGFYLAFHKTVSGIQYAPEHLRARGIAVERSGVDGGRSSILRQAQGEYITAVVHLNWGRECKICIRQMGIYVSCISCPDPMGPKSSLGQLLNELFETVGDQQSGHLARDHRKVGPGMPALDAQVRAQGPRATTGRRRDRRPRPQRQSVIGGTTSGGGDRTRETRYAS